MRVASFMSFGIIVILFALQKGERREEIDPA